MYGYKVDAIMGMDFILFFIIMAFSWGNSYPYKDKDHDKVYHASLTKSY